MSKENYKKCDVCDRTHYQSKVVSSAISPISLCYCSECIKNTAEPKSILESLIWSVNGKDNIHPNIRKRLTYYENGEYVSINNIDDSIIKELDEQYEKYCSENQK